MLDFGMAEGVRQGLRVDLVHPGDLDEDFRAQWRDLDNALEHPNPFFSQWFLEAALQCLDPEQRVRLCVVRRDSDDALMGLMPVTVEKGYAKLPLIHVAVWQHAHAYNGTPLIRRDTAMAVWGAWLDWMDGRPFGARFLRLFDLPFDDATRGPLHDACALAGRAIRVQYAHERAQVTAGQDYESMMAAALPGRKRKELRRQARRFGELGDAQIVDLPMSRAAICDAVEDFLALESAGWKGSMPDGQPLTATSGEQLFFAEAMRRGAREGAVSCLALTLGTTMTAMLFCLRSGMHLSAFKTTYDEAMAAYSPGMRLIMAATERMLAAPDIRRLDSCARPGHPVVDRLWPQRLPIVQANIPTGHAADAHLLDLAALLERSKIAAQTTFRKGKTHV